MLYYFSPFLLENLKILSVQRTVYWESLIDMLIFAFYTLAIYLLISLLKLIV